MIADFGGYRELRALAEELLVATDAALLHTTLALWLRLHCRVCGALIERELRRDDPPSAYCADCTAPAFLPPTSPRAAGSARGRDERVRTLDNESDDIPF